MRAVILESYVMEEGDLDWSGVKALVPDTTSYVRTDYADIAPRIGDAELVLINKSATPQDSKADLLIQEGLGKVFSQIQI